MENLLFALGIAALLLLITFETSCLPTYGKPVTGNKIYWKVNYLLGDAVLNEYSRDLRIIAVWQDDINYISSPGASLLFSHYIAFDDKTKYKLVWRFSKLGRLITRRHKELLSEYNTQQGREAQKKRGIDLIIKKYNLA